MNNPISTIKNNVLGAAIGGVGAFAAAKKFGKMHSWYALVPIFIAGAWLGSTAQATMKAHKSMPTAADVKK